MSFPRILVIHSGEPIGTMPGRSLLHRQGHLSVSHYGYDPVVSARLYRMKAGKVLETDDNPANWRRVPGFEPIESDRDQVFSQIIDLVQGQANAIRPPEPVRDTDGAAMACALDGLVDAIEAMRRRAA